MEIGQILYASPIPSGSSISAQGDECDSPEYHEYRDDHDEFDKREAGQSNAFLSSECRDLFSR